jgi:protein N-terminal methyltransferase
MRVLHFIVARCQSALSPNGFVCIKENTGRQGFYLDRSDLSVTRTDPHFRQLFAEAGLSVEKNMLQPGFPKELFPVRIYALK